MLRATEFSGGIVADRPDQMYGWSGMVRLANGDILVGASERKHHICPFGRIVIMRSRDGGQTWSLPQEIYNSEMDDRDTTLVALPDGTLIAAWFTSEVWMDPPFLRPEWAARRARVTDRILEEVVGDWLIRSHDGGLTWEKTATRLPNGGAEHLSPFALADGSLACFGYAPVAEGVIGLFFYKSADQGATWSQLGAVPCQRMLHGRSHWRVCHGQAVWQPVINERTLLELPSGRLLAIFRDDDGGYLCQSQSDDGGETWTEERATAMYGKPAHLLRLHDGAILCTYGHRAEPWSIRGVLSYDDGETWDVDNFITIEQWADQPDMGYPSALEVTPGEILTTYYCSRHPLTHRPAQEKLQQKGASPEGILWKRFRPRAG